MRARVLLRPMAHTLLLAMILGLMASCAHLRTTPIPADLPLDEGASVARLTEDEDHPLLLRGVDRQTVPFRVAMPGLLTHHYLLAPGKHLLWVQSVADVLYPLPIPVGYIHCYVLEADLATGKTYRLRESPSQQEAQLVEGEGSDRIIAHGPRVDRFPTGTRTCAWP